MTLLMFGKTGQVATEAARRAEVIALGRDAADLRQPAHCARAIHAHRPRAVLNAAAFTAVDGAESDAATAHLVNAEAPGAMARACADLGIPLIHISTDYVFPGTGARAWRETDPVAPRNVYGHSKLAGEEAIRRTGCAHVILRTSWVFSAHGANFVRTMLRLSESRDQLQVVGDQTGGPTPAADIAATCLSLADAMAAGAAPGGTYHYAGTPATSWADFARQIFALSGRSVRVTAIPSADYPTPAERPLNSRLDCAKLTTDFGITPPSWQAGLASVLNELGVLA